MRHLCGLSYRTHTHFLSYVSDSLYIKDQLYIRSANLIMSMLESPNASVRMLANLKKNVMTSIIGSNLNEIQNFFDIKDVSSQLKRLRCNDKRKIFTPECGSIMELLDIREHYYVLDGFSNEEVEEMLTYICTV